VIMTRRKGSFGASHSRRDNTLPGNALAKTRLE
jgi:hypothetical protein